MVFAFSNRVPDLGLLCSQGSCPENPQAQLRCCGRQHLFYGGALGGILTDNLMVFSTGPCIIIFIMKGPNFYPL